MKKISLITILIVIFAISCKQEKTILVVSVSDLNVRQNPSDTSKIIFQLTEGQSVYDLNEKSEKKDTFFMNDVKIADNWIKISTITGIEGWVFGGGVTKFEKYPENTFLVNQTEEFQNKSFFELQKIFSFYIQPIGKYNGKYSFYKTYNNKIILDGYFELTLSNVEAKTSVWKVLYIGTYKNGQLLNYREEIYNDKDYDSYVELSFKNNKTTYVFVKLTSDTSVLQYEQENPQFKTTKTAIEVALKKGKWYSID